MSRPGRAAHHRIRDRFFRRVAGRNAQRRVACRIVEQAALARIVDEAFALAAEQIPLEPLKLLPQLVHFSALFFARHRRLGHHALQMRELAARFEQRALTSLQVVGHLQVIGQRGVRARA